MTKHDNDYIGFDARQNLPFTVDALVFICLYCSVFFFFKNKTKQKTTSLMNLTCIWFVYQIAQNKCDKRIDIAAFLALKQIVDCSHPYSKYSVCIVMHSLLFSISIYNAAVKKMVTQESKISGPRSHS